MRFPEKRYLFVDEASPADARSPSVVLMRRPAPMEHPGRFRAPVYPVAAPPLVGLGVPPKTKARRGGRKARGL